MKSAGTFVVTSAFSCLRDYQRVLSLHSGHGGQVSPGLKHATSIKH
jgi:hypothetical protein